MSQAIVIQCFVKPDTLEGLCRRLTRCAGTEAFHLIFWSDMPGDGPNQARYGALNQAVLRYIELFMTTEAARFASITLRQNGQNLGTCRTCEVALDHAFALHDFVIFTEDDTIFAADALQWFSAMRALPAFADPRILAIAGESIYFDARGADLPTDYPGRAAAAATWRGLAQDYVALNFMPSTCFATTRTKWARFGVLRGQPRGDEDVCALCRDEKLDCLFPVLARVKDIGMQHQDDYSVRVLGADGVRETKNTYLMSDDVPAVPGEPRLFNGNMGRLFEASVKLTGFAPALAPPPPRAAAITTPPAWQLWCFSMRNFGDALTPYLMARYGVKFELVDQFEAANLLGIGSNLDRARRDNPPLIVWSAGFMYPKDRPVIYQPQIRFLGVRGLRTLAAIQPAKPADLVIGDGGLLVRATFPFANVPKAFDLGVVPHMSDVAAARALGMHGWPGVKFIDVLAPIDQVLRDIASCRRIVSSSLHGLITADAFGIANARGIFTGGRNVEGDGFKYGDYATALGYEVTDLPLGPGCGKAWLIDAVDAIPPRAPPADALIDDLEMTLAALRAAGRDLCAI